MKQADAYLFSCAGAVQMDCPETLWMLVPIVHCPECKKSHWLVDEQIDPPGSPQAVQGRQPVTFVCCNKMQYVFSDSARYKPMYVKAEA
jgi:hypothetical protein